MTVVAVGAAKGSPGVTTTVMALAARWPDYREPLVVEADPSGGDLVARLASLASEGHGLLERPSTVQLAAASRSGVSARSLYEHLQRLPGPGEVRALVSPPGAFAAATAIAALEAGGLASCLAGLGSVDALIDAGRIDPTSPSLPLVRAAGVFVLVVRPTLESVLHSRDLASTLRGHGCFPHLVVIGDRPYVPSEVANAVGSDRSLLELPDDPVGAAALRGEARSPKVLARTRLLRAAGEVAAILSSTDAGANARLAPSTDAAVPRTWESPTTGAIR